jgi:hypothetical protein
MHAQPTDDANVDCITLSVTSTNVGHYRRCINDIVNHRETQYFSGASILSASPVADVRN